MTRAEQGAGIADFPVGLFTLDLAGRLLTGHPALDALLGAPAPPGALLSARLHPADQPRLQDAVARAVAGPDAAYEACRLPGAAERWVEFRLRAVREEDGAPVCLAGACAELPGAVHTHGPLVRDAHLQLLLAHSSDVMSIMTADERCLYITEGALLRISGYTPEEYLARSIYDYLHPDDLPRVAAQVAEWRAHPPEEAVIVARIRMKSGAYRWMEGRTRPILDAEGRILYAVQINRDITAQKQLEYALQARTEDLARANAALERAIRLKDEFLASMSHELRTPLTAILGLAEALQLGMGGGLSDEQQEMMHTLEDSGRHLLALINDILDLAKAEAGRLELEPVALCPAECVESVVRLFRETARRRGLSLVSTLDPAVRTLIADARRLKQMLINLLGNAVKFTPAGGQIGVEMAGDPAQGVVRFTVWDTGIGIDSADLERLFTPFVQLDAGLARQYPGTGLGLSLVKRMAELHGGTVSVTSTPGGGSRFTLALPWSPAAARDGAPDGVRETPPRYTAAPAATILLAEDHEVLAELLTEFLTTRGYRVTRARTGYEVLARALEHLPHLILMDVRMPALDGLETTRQLRRHPILADVPILAITAQALPEDRARCLAAGMTDYLAKPFSLETLAARITRHLEAGPHAARPLPR